MEKISIEELIVYLRENIEDFEERLDLAISKGYKQHIMPSQCDIFLTEEIYDKAYEYAEDNDIAEEEMEEFLEEAIDDIFFQ